MKRLTQSRKGMLSFSGVTRTGGVVAVKGLQLLWQITRWQPKADRRQTYDLPVVLACDMT